MLKRKSPDITGLCRFSEARQLDRLLMQQYPSVSDSLLSFSPTNKFSHTCAHTKTLSVCHPTHTTHLPPPLCSSTSLKCLSFSPFSACPVYCLHVFLLFSPSPPLLLLFTLLFPFSPLHSISSLCFGISVFFPSLVFSSHPFSLVFSVLLTSPCSPAHLFPPTLPLILFSPLSSHLL